MKIHINSVLNVQKDQRYDSYGKEFSQARNLMTHIDSVNGQKDHKYDSCGKTISQARDCTYQIYSTRQKSPYKILF